MNQGQSMDVKLTIAMLVILAWGLAGTTVYYIGENARLKTLIQKSSSAIESKER